MMMKSGVVGQMGVPSWQTFWGVSDMLSKLLDVWTHQGRVTSGASQSN